MKTIIIAGFTSFCCVLLFSCNNIEPARYFDVAVLNSNMLVGFADEGMTRQLASPPVKLDEKGTAAPMKRSEFLGEKIKSIQTDFDKLKELKETPDTRDMLKKAREMYNYVLPVYKTDYRQLADLYDGGASKERLEAEIKKIHDNYYTGYNELYDKLIAVGKLYAARHEIKVNWAF